MGIEHDDLLGLLRVGVDGVDMQIPEAVRQRPLRSRGDGLAAKEQHLVFEQGAMDLLELPLGQGLGQIDPGDLGADMGAQGGDGQLVGHCLAPCQGARRPGSNTKAM
ncbi:hypothetical protein D3C85_1418330 [compost metagenome]